ncbi:MAG: DUF5989 family protein [Bacteroidia bacterium]
MDILRDLWQYMRERKKIWLAPVIMILLFMAILLVYGAGSAVAPFIYSLF